VLVGQVEVEAKRIVVGHIHEIVLDSIRPAKAEVLSVADRHVQDHLVAPCSARNGSMSPGPPTPSVLKGAAQIVHRFPAPLLIRAGRRAAEVLVGLGIDAACGDLSAAHRLGEGLRA